MQDVPEFRLEPRPELLNRVEVGRIRREEQDLAAVLGRHRAQARLPVERGVVHHHDLPLPEPGEQHPPEPGLERVRVHRAAVAHRRQDLAAPLAGDHAHALKPPPADPPGHRNPGGRPRAGAVEERLYPCLVHIRGFSRRHAGDGVAEGFALPLVALPEGGGFFFRV